ncbi:MAG: hypothetical protein AAB617_02080 [Patescibacteria group bacterium]
MNLKLKNIVVKSVIVGLVAMPFLAFAAAPTTVDAVLNLVKQVVNIAAYLFFIVAALFIILAAFTYLTAAGDEEKVKKAKQELTYAVVAIVIAALAFAIPAILGTFVGISVPTTLPTGTNPAF